MDKSNTGTSGGNRTQSHVFWASAFVATVAFVAAFFMMSMVPGLYQHEKLQMVAAVASLLICSLGFGLWGFRTADAPLMRGRIGALMGVVLLLEALQCVIAFVQLRMVR